MKTEKAVTNTFNSFFQEDKAIMKKILSILLVLFTVSAGFAFAEAAASDPFDSLVEKLLKDFDDDGATVAVKK